MKGGFLVQKLELSLPSKILHTYVKIIISLNYENKFESKKLLFQKLEVSVEGVRIDRALADFQIFSSGKVVDVVQAHLVLEGEAADRRVRLASRVVPTCRHEFVTLNTEITIVI
jgi:hypothetical protein